MSAPLSRLRRLLGDQQPTAGEVVAVDGDRLTVATRQGPVSATRQAGDGTVYRVGDRVRLGDGVIRGRALSTIVMEV